MAPRVNPVSRHERWHRPGIVSAPWNVEEESLTPNDTSMSSWMISPSVWLNLQKGRRHKVTLHHWARSLRKFHLNISLRRKRQDGFRITDVGKCVFQSVRHLYSYMLFVTGKSLTWLETGEKRGFECLNVCFAVTCSLIHALKHQWDNEASVIVYGFRFC